MPKRMLRCAAVTSGAAFVAAATAMAGPGPIHRPPLTTTSPKQASAPLHVVVPTAITLPGGRYAWAQPLFVRSRNGLFLVLRTPVA